MMQKIFLIFLASLMVISIALSSPLSTQSAPARTLNSASAEKPTIRFTHIPAFGSFSNLQGIVSGVDPAQYQVAVYIKVRKGWWTKPYWSRPATSVYPDGTWVCDVTTGGIDQYASHYAAYLIPKTFSPPLRRGEGSLPAGINKKAAAKVMVPRSAQK